MKSIISELRNDTRFNHVTTTTLIEIAEAVIIDRVKIFEVRLKDVVPDGFWYSKKIGQRVYVIDTGLPFLRTVHDPNLTIDREHIKLRKPKRLPIFLKHLTEN